MRWLALVFLLASCTCSEPPPEPATPASIQQRIPEKGPASDAPTFAPRPLHTDVNTDATIPEAGASSPVALDPSVGTDPEASPPDAGAK